MSLVSTKHLAWLSAVVCGLCLTGFLYSLIEWQRPYDPDFDTIIGAPSYQNDRPMVLFDEGHRNSHTASGAYKPFADLIQSDGYELKVLREPVSAGTLAGAQVLVLVCPRGTSDTEDDPAYTEKETAAIDHWVRSGGSLLLITDHWPYGAAAENLGKKFGIDMSKGMVQDPKHFEATLEESHLVFSRENQLLANHPITQGRNASERIERILTFTGQSVQGPQNATSLLKLADTAVDLPPSKPQVETTGGDKRVTMEYGQPVSAGGRAQALALQVDRGRVVVLGEAGMLRAYRDQRGSPVGMNFPGYDNRQLALNILHWLSRLL